MLKSWNFENHDFAPSLKTRFGIFQNSLKKGVSFQTSLKIGSVFKHSLKIWSVFKHSLKKYPLPGRCPGPHWARDPGPGPKKSSGPGPLELFFGLGPGSRAQYAQATYFLMGKTRVAAYVAEGQRLQLVQLIFSRAKSKLSKWSKASNFILHLKNKVGSHLSPL